jgi:selenide,water dikinase
VYLLPGGIGLVQTVDFFTPIVDDPFDWGRIAAANAFSDVYAMGGRPITAMNLVAWPVKELPLELLAQVLEGAAHVAGEAGVAIVGGHSIHDDEPKFGMAVSGLVDPAKIVRNSTILPGDRLVLTKPLGLGIISTAIKAGTATQDQLRSAIETMTTLNRAASEAMVEAGASAATDVTGFGLLGHLAIALAASGVAARIDAAAVPLLEGVVDLARRGTVPSGSRANHAFVAPSVEWGELPEAEQLVLADAQTSGGLLIAVAPARHAALTDALEAAGIRAAVVGVAEPGTPGHVTVEGRLRG